MPRYAPVRSLRSSSFSICVPLRKTSKATSRSFSSVASKIWNALPGHLSSIPTLPPFRRCLKHYSGLRAHPARHLVATRHLNVSLFLIRHHLLPLNHSNIPCRPAKRVPSECLRLAKVIKPTYFGARINAALLIYLLTTWTIFL